MESAPHPIAAADASGTFEIITQGFDALRFLIGLQSDRIHELGDVVNGLSTAVRDLHAAVDRLETDVGTLRDHVTLIRGRLEEGPP